MTKYNSLNNIKVDLSQSGICVTCGRRLTDADCTHATPEQREYTRRMDANIDADFAARATYGKNWEQDASDLAALVDVVNASEPLGAVDLQQASDWQDTPVTDPADVSKYFNGYKATASKAWRARHLNEGG